MCDCYNKICECRTYTVPIHIADFGYPRSIITATYCPQCSGRIPLDEVEYECRVEGNNVELPLPDKLLWIPEFFLVGSIVKEKFVLYKHTSATTAFVLQFKNKSGLKYWHQDVMFNGDPAAPSHLVMDCVRFKCKHYLGLFINKHGCIKKLLMDKYPWMPVQQPCSYVCPELESKRKLWENHESEM